jgi:DNA invertase Pin-like site-specific DNA recombinase
MIYGYIHRSTSGDNQNIERKTRKLVKLGVKKNEIFLEECGSKGNTVREVLNWLLYSHAKSGDTIVVTEISQLAQSTEEFFELIERVKKKRLELVVGKFRVDCRQKHDPMTDGALKMMKVFAEIEHNTRSQHIKSGMEKSKAEGKKLGRPATCRENLPTLFLQHYPKYQLKKINQEELAHICGLTRQTVSKYLKIIKKTDEEICVAEIEADFRKERVKYKEEQERLKDYKRMTNAELRAIAQGWEEAGNAQMEGVSKDFTPATYELKRREKRELRKYEKQVEEIQKEAIRNGITDLNSILHTYPKVDWSVFEVDYSVGAEDACSFAFYGGYSVIDEDPPMLDYSLTAEDTSDLDDEFDI